MALSTRSSFSLATGSALALVVTAAAACAFDSGPLPGSGGDADAGPGADAGADADPTGPVGHLLITEVNAKPEDEEFIEIYNPTGVTVQLRDYYLSDDRDYALLPGLFGDGPEPDIRATDFIVRFPADAAISDGEVIVIARDGALMPGADYALLNAAPGRAMTFEAGEPTDSVTITDAGEGVVLLFWDRQSDLVRDVDLIQTGATPESFNRLVAKTDIVVDGPDPDSDASQYARDIADPQPFDTEEGIDESYQRIAREVEDRDVGGNGIGGDDETSEDIRMTWTQSGSFLAPSPGTIPDSLRSE